MSPTCWLTTGSFKSLTMLVFYEIAGEKRNKLDWTLFLNPSLWSFFSHAQSDMILHSSSSSITHLGDRGKGGI